MSESKTAFIYIRRSSEKNKLTSISIDKQIEETQKECIKKGFKILNIFIDNKSRFIAGKRDNFDKMLKDLRERNIKGKGEKVDYIVVYMASRLSRNYLEASIISELVLSGNINIVSIKEGIDCSNLKGKKSAISIMNEAVFDNIEKSIEGVRNMNERYKRGYLPKQLPIGYKQIGYGDKRKYVTDTENDTDKNVIKIFELYSTGKYSYKSLSNKLKNEGVIRNQ
ncbi:MAG: recombinase family protein, partial [Candidatus Gracilibacteria bacterium]|nr:recombinase family protein [Candidatus Gracilibacteria bacterium]